MITEQELIELGLEKKFNGYGKFIDELNTHYAVRENKIFLFPRNCREEVLLRKINSIQDIKDFHFGLTGEKL